ncbi:MAG: hypothetical protein JEY99_13175 [Spirochaetales bacterium]|nr:hypothetical protein [Spirochaetales bacterium]
MAINYYLMVFPTESLIASGLEPEQFGSYMAIGSRKGSEEQVIFAELEGESESAADAGEGFDWAYAKEKCVPHPNGDPKHSVYLAVYRVLERIPQSSIKTLYMVTKDGRTLKLEQSEYREPKSSNGIFVYQQFCPLNPVIVSVLPPREFGKQITAKKEKISVPHMLFGDLKPINFDDPDHSGNLGGLYDNQLAHFLDCVSSVKSRTEKMNKTYNRSHLESFTYNSINQGLYFCRGEEILYFAMPSENELKQIDYDWGRSALIL